MDDELGCFALGCFLFFYVIVTIIISLIFPFWNHSFWSAFGYLLLNMLVSALTVITLLSLANDVTEYRYKNFH